MTIEEIKNNLKWQLSSKRFEHSLGVMACAVQLARRYGEDEEKAAIAGLLHDCARDIKGDELLRLCERYNITIDNISRVQPELLHGPLGSKLAAEEYGIYDDAILKSICYHTTGRENMSMLEKIIFLADYIEPGREFNGVEKIRKEAFVNIDRAIVLSMDSTIKYIISKGSVIHIDTICARNFFLLSLLHAI